MGVGRRDGHRNCREIRLITFDRVSFTYPGADRCAIENISFFIEPGSVTLVTGSLGSGCSTLLLVAAGLAPHLTGGTLVGKAVTLGVEVGAQAAHRQIAGRVGLLLPAPWTQLSGVAFSVADEVAFGPANLGRPRDRIARAVERAMALAGVSHLAERDPTTLSGGELQRVILAGIIALEPEVYLLDEPAVELDPEAADAFYRMLPELAREAAVVLATTDTDRAVEVAARVILLERGRCIAQGTPDGVLGSEKTVSASASTTVAQIAHAAGLSGPFPLTPEALALRFNA
ncbi:MAG: ABC transporter ATP-binding protein [Gemmatimonadetes bacterium]|nr:ABC transporter ATP-binding protein [Gemmatimonadota bacterium]